VTLDGFFKSHQGGEGFTPLGPIRPKITSEDHDLEVLHIQGHDVLMPFIRDAFHLGMLTITIYGNV
jgi:hypothetical protein